MPILGGQNVPRSLRLIGAVVFSLFIVPVLWHHPLSSPENLLVCSILIIREFLTGLAMGTFLVIFFSGLSMAGDLIGRLSGISLSGTFDPVMGEEISVTSKFILLTGMVLFILSGGLSQFVMGFLDSFQQLPPGSLLPVDSLWNLFLMLLISSFNLAVRLSAPVVIATLSLFLVIGFLGRTFPQLNLMFSAFSCNTLLTLALLHLGIGLILVTFQNEIVQQTQILFQVFRTTGP